MSRASELIAQIEGTGTTQPKSRAAELIAQLEQPLSTSPPILQQSEQPNFSEMIARAEKPMIDLSGKRQGDVDYLTKLDEVPANAPDWARKYPVAYTGVTRAKDLVSPTAQALSYYGGSLVGGPPGAGLLNSMEQNLENAFDVYMGRKPQPSIAENFLQSGKNFANAYTLEGLSKNISNVKDYIPEKIKNIAKSILPKKPTNMALEAEKQAKDIGVNMLPSDVRQSKSLAQIEAGMGRLLGSSSLLQNEDKKNIMAIIREAKSITEKSGSPTTPEDLGRKIYEQIDDYLNNYTKLNQERLESVRSGIKNIIGSPLNPVKLSETTAEAIGTANKGMYDKSQALYAERNKLIPKEGVPLNNTLATAQKWQKALSQREPTEVDSMLRSRVNEIIKLSEREVPLDSKVYENLWAKPVKQKIIPKADLNVLAEFKSNINADLVKINPAMRYAQEGIKGATKPGQSLPARAYAELANSMERDINAYSRGIGGGLTEANRAAINYYREFKQLTNHPDFVKILKSNPDEVLNKINDITDVRLMKKALGEDKFKELIKPAFTNKIFGTGVEAYNPESATKAIIKYSNVIPEVYSQSEIKLIQDSIEKGTFIQGNLEKLDRKFLKSLVNIHNPKTTIDAVFTGGKSKYAERNLRYIYGIADKETKDKLKYYLSEKVLFGGQKVDPSTLLTDNRAYQDFSFNTLAKNIQNNESIIKRFHSQEVINRMKRLANIGKYMQSSGKYAGMKIAETGQSTWALSQIGAFAASLGSGNVPGAMAIMMGPAASTATYLSKPVRGAISHGVSMPSWLEVGTKYGTLMSTRDKQENPIQYQMLQKQ